jgi:hypothetical protein
MRALVLVVPLVLFSSAASASEGIEHEASSANRDPDAHWAFEARFGAYRPRVDETLRQPIYENYFGSRTRFMIGGEVDYQPIHIRHFASLGFGGIVGYTRATGTAPFKDGSAGSDETTTLSQWNFAAVANLRIDVIARETWIPIVPYAKLGLATSLWKASNESGTSVDTDGSPAAGHTNGIFYALGGMLMLDFFDRQAAKTFSVEQGVTHTYFFAEYTVWSLKGLGQSNGAMHVGDATWTLGLSFEH